MAYTNPAFAMLGIKQIKLPSRNWMIFWTVLGTMTGGVVYDKWQQRKLRDEFMQKYQNQVKDYPINQMHRKLRIYISPPPNDYMEESMKYFRRFVKPIINSSGLDYELITMERQGDIRYRVAEEIRQIRREKAGLSKKEEDEQPKEPETVQDMKVINPVFNSVKNDMKPDEEVKKLRELYEPMDVLGVKKVFGNLQDLVKNLTYEDANAENVKDAGGVICIGRGAYKEYINGVHEGLLGPLDAPLAPIEEAKIGDDEQKAEAKKDDEEEDKYAPAAHIYYKDYSNAEMAPELGLNMIDYGNESEVLSKLNELRDEHGRPYFFVQPILQLRNYNTAGFTKQPERIWRFYNKRNQLIEYNELLVKVIEKKWCFFEKSNLDSGIGEEFDWPSSWVKFAQKNNSEWVRDFGGDDRVLKLLASYNCETDTKSDKDK